jgi:uncharacterized repeat protein (TIGR03803 family)
MHSNKLLILRAMAAVILIASPLMGVRAASQELVLHNFGNNTKGGVEPSSQLAFDSAGNLYGTTAGGGISNVGTVFELAPVPGGGWVEKGLHSFAKNNTDGQFPGGGPLIFDPAGNLYGTTENGGTDGVGTVFELSPPVPPSTNWTEKVIYSFSNNGIDGQDPVVGLVRDSAGNLYGTTLSGGTSSSGTVFELSLTADGAWAESLLHTFSAKGTTGDGRDGRSNLIFDSAGNLYGTTDFGGAQDEGTVYELSPSGAGTWTETVLYSFFTYPTDAWFPAGGVVLDSAGNLYGATAEGGPGQGGAVYELTPSGTGSWTEKLLYAFDYRNKTDGTSPIGNLTFDSAGNLYGTTFSGGSTTCVSGCGIVFELKPAGTGWIERILHNFVDNGVDGYSPAVGVILDSAENLYGTTPYGGKFGGPDDQTNGGSVFEVRH